MAEVRASKLYAKTLGALLGAAVGDAMGGPVEGLSHGEIERRYGRVDSLLSYDKPPSEHAQFTNHPGNYTDDTRLHLILCEAVIQSGGHITRGDFAEAPSDYRATHTSPLERSFVEEYYLKALYSSRKLIFGGQATNGALMAKGALGLTHPADPKGAFLAAFELAFVTDGYAKESAAAVAAAMRPGATVTSVVEEMISTADWFRRDGPYWQDTMRTRDWARVEGCLNHELVRTALEVARTHKDVLSIREALYPLLSVSPIGSEAGQTPAVALAMLVAADGDYATTVIGAVNYGRDNDSYATVAGAIAGALGGTGAIPQAWVSCVHEANPKPDLREVAFELTRCTLASHAEQERTVRDVEGLLACN
jgi:ADP-ribosylglycohydrolase